MLDDDYGGLLLGGESSIFKDQTLLSTLNSTDQSTLFSKNFAPLMMDPRKPITLSMSEVQTASGLKPN